MNRATLKAYLKRTRNSVYVLADFLYDAVRFIKYSHLGGRIRNEGEYHGVVTMEYHRLEKGLTLPNPRPFFGTGTIAKLLTLVRETRFTGVRARRHALESIDSYFNEHNARGFRPETGGELARYRAAAGALIGSVGGGRGQQAGIVRKTAEQIRGGAGAMDFEKFMADRHSIRDYSTRPVTEVEILNAVETAMRAPSVCNRQAWQCYFTSDQAVIEQALKCQNGNAGFRSRIPAVCIITSRMSYFVSSGERYQAWIDGGMFAMALVLALHGQSMGSCCLNWSVDWWQDRKLRKAVSIPDDETVIMMLSVGHLPEEFSVCVSPRRSAVDVLRKLRA